MQGLEPTNAPSVSDDAPSLFSRVRRADGASYAAIRSTWPKLVAGSRRCFIVIPITVGLRKSGS